MFPIKMDFRVIQGSPFKKTFKFSSKTGPIILTGYNFRGVIRKNNHESAIAVNLNPVIVDAANGIWKFHVPASVTETLQFATGVYDIEWIPPGDEPQQILFGNILVVREATR